MPVGKRPFLYGQPQNIVSQYIIAKPIFPGVRYKPEQSKKSN